mgnify:FL=1
MDASAAKVPAKEAAGKKEKPRRKSRHIFRKILVFVLILALLAGAGWYFFQSLRAEYTVTYQPYMASIGTISNALSFNGTLQAVNNATYTAESDGTVKAIYVKAGDQVKTGDKLIRLSTGQLVKAEFDGEVNVMDLAEGDAVAAGATLCQVVDFQHMKTSIRIDEYDINSVHVGDAIRVTTTANEKTFDATIAAINHTSSSSGSVAYYTATAFVNVDSEVYPGMQVTVTLPQEEAQDVVILKMNAISFDEDNQAFVYTRDENGEMQKTYITTGVSNGSYTEIKDGLQSGDTVYAEVETESSSGVSSLFSSLFGQTQFAGNPGGNAGRDGKDFNFDPGNFDPGNMPSFNGESGGRGSFGGGRQ